MTPWQRSVACSGSLGAVTTPGGSARLRLGPVQPRSSRATSRQCTSKVGAPTARHGSGSNSGTAGWSAPGSVSPGCCGWRAERGVIDARDRQSCVACLVRLLHPTSCNASSLPPRRIAYGSLTAPLSPPGRGFALWPSSSMCTVGVWSGGRWPIICAVRSPAKRSLWPSPDGDQRRGHASRGPGQPRREPGLRSTAPRSWTHGIHGQSWRWRRLRGC